MVNSQGSKPTLIFSELVVVFNTSGRFSTRDYEMEDDGSLFINSKKEI